MADFIDYDNYENMINALKIFSSTVSDACEEMADAGNQCVENMDADEASEKSNARLQECISSYKGILETAQNLINAMQEELERAKQAVSKINSL